MSCRRLQNVFSVTIFCLPRRLERRNIVTLKTSWRHVLKTSSRRLRDKQNVYWEYLYLTNLNLYPINPYVIYLYLTNQGESKMHPIQISPIISIFLLSWNSSISILRIKISDDYLVVVKSVKVKFDIAE